MKFAVFIIFLVSVASANPGPICGENEYEVKCKTLCPPQSCDFLTTTYMCDPEPKCIPGCDCVANYLRNKEDKCIPSDKCTSFAGRVIG